VIHAPRFWWDDQPGALARLLAPLAWVWGKISSTRMQRRGQDVGAPVICVGNFVLGGAGKTPIAIEIAGRLSRIGQRPAILSRGYGGSGRTSPARVVLETSDPRRVGDEAVLLARTAPTYVGADRVASARMAIDDGATSIVMDDGLQNPALGKRLSLVVVDAEAGCGNRLCLPAGPLRAPLEEQWRLASAIILVGQGSKGEELAKQAEGRKIPVLRATLEPDEGALARISGSAVVAFAGIGRPSKFHDMLRRRGIQVVAERSFPDHHVYSARDIESLRRLAMAKRAILATTEKDAVKIPFTAGLEIIPVRALFTPPDSSALDVLLARALRTPN
jgi:tetraacyldisaccharide 4'-kinase